MVLIAAMLVLAPWTGYAGSVKITVNDDPDLSEGDGWVEIKTMGACAGIKYGYSGVIPYVYFDSPIGYLEGEGRADLPAYSDHHLLMIKEYNDSNGNYHLDSDHIGPGPIDYDGEQVYKMIRFADIADEWTRSDPEEVSIAGGRKWTMSLTAENITYLAGNGTIARISLDLSIFFSRQDIDFSIPCFTVNNGSLERSGMRNYSERVTEVAIEWDLSIDGWRPHPDNDNCLISVTYGYMLFLDYDEHPHPFTEVNLLEEDADLSFNLRTNGTFMNLDYWNSLDMRSPVDQQSRICGGTKFMNYTKSRIGEYTVPGINYEKDVRDNLLSARGMDVYGPGSGGINSTSGHYSGIYLTNEISNQETDNNSYVSVWLSAISIHEMENDPNLKLGFSFYLPLMFIITLVAATVAVNYHRRDME